ncbi:MAG: hypothetical protein MUE53_00475 [Chitinophagales bacterium]|jgi:hypothetical protein|nr:hypothetical protein [Chitinophagales bacterium]
MLFDNGFQFTTLINKNEYSLDKRKLEIGDADSAKKFISKSLKKLKIKLKEDETEFKFYLFFLDTLPKELQKIGVDGVLGRDLISYYDWKIDYEKQTASIIKDKNLLLTENMIKIPFYSSKNIDYLKFKIDDEIQTIQIDFGCDCFLYLNDKFVKNCETDSLYLTRKITSVVKNKIDTFNLKFRSLVSDSYRLENIPIKSNKNVVKSLIGTRFFSVFNEVIMSYKDSAIYFKPFRDAVVCLPKVEVYDNKVKTLVFSKNNASIFRIDDEINEKELNFNNCIKNSIYLKN